MLTACTWTDLLDQPDPIATIEVNQAPRAPATSPQQSRPAKQDLSGQWVGVATLDDGASLYYELDLSQDGTVITGLAYASDEEGAASVDVLGTYEDGLLQLNESGGETSGGWSSLCYWALELHLTGTSSRMRLEGTLEGIPNSEGTCNSRGEINISRQ